MNIVSLIEDSLKGLPSTIYVLHNVGVMANNPNYNTKEQISKVDYLTFDGIYKNVWENREILKGKQFILFITGAYIGKDNVFDRGKMPFEEMCNWNQIMDLVMMGGKLGWHTWTHPNLTRIRDENILRKEITPPFPMDYFAYPYGKFSQKAIEIVKDVGFKYAFSVRRGDGSRYQLKRKYLR